MTMTTQDKAPGKVFESTEAYEFHPFANTFPLMNDKEWQWENFLADLKTNGQRETVKLTSDDKIADGRNRFRACKQLGIPCKFEYLATAQEQDLRGYIESLNAHRRHLSKAQVDDAIANLREQGKSIPQIAKETGKSIGAVHNAIKKAEKKKGKPLTTTVKTAKGHRQKAHITAPKKSTVKKEERITSSI